MRLSELVGLDVSSVDHRFRGVRVMGKGRKERILPVGAPALAHAFGNLFAIFGTPDKWAHPLVLKVVEKKSRRGYKFFDIELVSEKGRK